MDSDEDLPSPVINQGHAAHSAVHNCVFYTVIRSINNVIINNKTVLMTLLKYKRVVYAYTKKGVYEIDSLL